MHLCSARAIWKKSCLAIISGQRNWFLPSVYILLSLGVLNQSKSKGCATEATYLIRTDKTFKFPASAAQLSVKLSKFEFYCKKNS
jgi:hypothetical protein